MARPRTDNGFVMIAIDLFPAIMSAGLSGYAQIVLAEVLIQSYGPRKKERVALWPVDLSELTGLERNNARRAIRELVEAGILVPEEDRNTFRFVKDYETWTPPLGRLDSRLGGGLIRWIKGAIGRLGATSPIRRIGKRQESTQTPKVESGGVYPDSSRSLPRLLPTTVVESTQTPTQDDPTKERACVRVLGISSSSPVVGTKEDKKTKDEDEDDDDVVPKLGPEYTAVGQFAIELTCDFSWGKWVSEQGLIGRPAAWIRRAIEEASGNGKLHKPYVAKLLQGYHVAKGPPANAPGRPAQPVRPSPAPLPIVKADPESTHPKHRTESQHRDVAAKWGVPMEAYYERIGLKPELAL